MFGKRFIKQSDITKSSDYEKSVIDFYRREAARSIQSITRLGHFKDEKINLVRMSLGEKGLNLTTEEKQPFIGKSTLILSDEQLYLLRVQANGQPKIKRVERHAGNDAQYLLLINMMSAWDYDDIKAPTKRQRSMLRSLLSTTQKLLEPLDLAPSQQLARLIKELRYEDLNFSLPEFTLHLFSALRANLITMNEMMTAKLMYESLSCFKHKKFQRKMLTNSSESYHPSKTILSWGAKEEAELQDESARNRLYYTFELPRYVHAGFLYYALENIAQGYDNEIKALQLMLHAYFKFSKKQFNEEDWFFVQESIQSLSEKVGAEELQEFIVSTVDGRLFFKNVLLSSYDNQARKKIDDLKFMAATTFEARFPFFCFASDDPTRLCVALPTLDTFNTIFRIAFKEEAVLPIAAIGPGEDTRQIRAYGELPGLTKFTQTQALFKSLYPIAADLERSSRNVEIPVEGIPRTKNPHNLELSNFMLMGHDLFHVFNSSMQFKKFHYMLRQLHDEKGGFAENKSGMSKALWKLTDLSFYPLEMICLSTNQIKNFYLKRLESLKDVDFDFSKKNDNNYLLLHDEYHHPDQWASVFLGKTLGEVLEEVKSIEGYNPELIDFLKNMREEKNKVSAYLQGNPSASVVEFILQDLMGPFVRSLSLEKVFTWTPNEGLYFKKEIYVKNNLSALGVNRKLRSLENTPEVLQSALQIVARQLSPVSVGTFFREISPSPDYLSKKYDPRDNLNAPLGPTPLPRSLSPNPIGGSV